MTDTHTVRTVLIADDDTDIRGVVSGALHELGYQIFEASDGAKAVALLPEVSFDLAVLDVTMPGLTGIEVCRAIKDSVDGKMIPVIMLTALDRISDKVSALESGADDYLTKPFHYVELQARVKALMRVRELSLSLKGKNDELIETQEKLISKERQLLAYQLGGTAAHKLGQPLSAIMLNLHLLENLPPSDERYQKALAAIKQDSKAMSALLEKFKGIDASDAVSYYGTTSILDLEKSGR